MSHQTRNGKQTAILAYQIEAASSTTTTSSKKKTEKLSKKDMMFQLYRPNTGLQFRAESLAEIEKKYKKVQSDEAETHWTHQYDASVNTCSHAYWRGNCRNVSMGQECEVKFCRCNYQIGFFCQCAKLCSLFRLVLDDVRTPFYPARCLPYGVASKIR